VRKQSPSLLRWRYLEYISGSLVNACVRGPQTISRYSSFPVPVMSRLRQQIPRYAAVARCAFSSSAVGKTKYVSSLPPTIAQRLSALSDTSSDSVASQTSTTVTGWLRSVRKQKRIAFAEVTDGSTVQGLQAVIDFGGGGKEDLETAARRFVRSFS